MGVAGKKVGSMKNLKKSLKKGSEGYLKRIPADGIMVRFMTEPDEFVEFKEHYNDTDKFFPCADECPECESGNTRGSTRYLANVVDVTESRVEGIVIPKSLMQQLSRKYDKYGTLMDRNYELLKSGTTKNDTEYSLDNEGPEPFKMKRYEPLDLLARLTAQLPGGDDEDDDGDDDDEPVKSSKPKKVKKNPAAKTGKSKTVSKPLSKPIARKPVAKKIIKKKVSK